MAGERAGIFDADTDLDLSGFAPEPTPRPAARPEQIRAVSEAAHFHSRESRPERAPTKASEPETAPVRREQRRYRTGRNVQLNIKARAEAIEAFYAIADIKGWVLGEAFEQAVAALKREIDGQL